MTTEQLSAQEQAALRLSEREGKAANLWRDAWERLLRNRAAVLGGIVVILLWNWLMPAIQHSTSPSANGFRT